MEIDEIFNRLTKAAADREARLAGIVKSHTFIEIGAIFGNNRQRGWRMKLRIVSFGKSSLCLESYSGVEISDARGEILNCSHDS